jgi:hypothetical protein
MEKFTPAAPFSNVTSVGNCAIFDASALLYQPALRAAVIQEQVALLATRLAVARWTSGQAAPRVDQPDNPPPYRAAFYARAQDEFFAWIERGGVWEGEGAATPAPTQNDGAEAVVRTTVLRSTPAEE